MPELAALRRYRIRSDFNSDLFDCVLVEVVALPVSIACAKLAGMSPAVGLYANFGPPLAHELRDVVAVYADPDAENCATLAAAVSFLGRRSMPDLSLAAALNLFTGILCMLASNFRLGVLANFLFRPILVGFLNGIALSIFLGQIGKGIGRVPSLVCN